MFSPILNRGQDPEPLITEHPFGNDERGVCPFIRLIKMSKYYQLTTVFGSVNRSRKDCHGLLCV